MTAMSNTLELLVLDATLRGQSLGVTGDIKLALHTGDPGEDGTSNEVTGGDYARQTATFSAASSGAIAMSGTVSFTGMPEATVSHVSLWDSSGTPKCLYKGALSASKAVASGDTYTQSTLTVSLD